MPSIINRKFAEKDKKELNDLYNLVAGRSRTVPQFEWEWLNTPEGWGTMWLLEDTDTGKIIGHHGLIPIRCHFFDKQIMLGKTENTVMHPHYRGKGIYFPFEAKFIQEAKDNFHLLYTTAGIAEHGAIRIKLGYTNVGGYAHYLKFMKRSSLNRMITQIVRKRIGNKLVAALLIGAAKLGSIMLMPLFSRKGPRDQTITLREITGMEAIAEPWDKFWEGNSGKFGITVSRNSRYLQWRIFDNPNIDHTVFLAERQGKMVGYAITKTSREAGPEMGTFVDIIADNNDDVILNSILDRVEEKFRERNIYVLHFPTLLSGNSLNRALKRNGFIFPQMLWKAIYKFTGRKKAWFQVKALDESLDPAIVNAPASWYFTNLFAEGVI
jgi:GNAT superfamily N-acetyltransferase